MKRIGHLLFMSGLLALAACNNGNEENNNSKPSTPVEENNNKTDDGDSDSKVEPKKEWGVISGPCGVLDNEEWNSNQPFFFTNHIDFGDEGYVAELLSNGASYIMKRDNAGGSSVASEALAYEMLYRCEKASLVKIENEIEYQGDGSITDILVEIDNRYVGVSVTRAYPWSGSYTLDEARKILNKKLSALRPAQENAVEEDRWDRSVLYILAGDEDSANKLKEAWDESSDELKEDSIVMVTVTDGVDEFVYKNK